MPKVTVLMSVYNQERFVREAIDSILSQTFTDFEFLILNDGSSDRTRSIVSSYEDSRIVLVDNERNIGLTRSLNKGLNLARGEYIARLDSDDIVEPERLAKQVAFLEANPDIALVGSWYREIDERGNLSGEHSLPIERDRLRWNLLFYTPFLNSSVTFRKDEILQKVGGYNEDFIYAQDHEFWVRIARIFPCANLDEYLVRYRVHTSSITLSHETRQREFLFQSCRTYLSLLLDSGQISRSLDRETFTDLQSLLGYSELPIRQDFDFKKLPEYLSFLFQLSQAFGNYYRLTDLDRQRHESYLITRIHERLLVLAADYCRKNRSITRKLLAEGIALNRGNLFSKSYLITWLKCLAGPSLLNRFNHLPFANR